MSSNLNKVKNTLAPGEQIRLCYDEAFKIMFGREKHLEPLTVLVANIIGVDYHELEGKITLLPVTIPNDVAGSKKQERDVVVKISEDEEKKIILEVNFKERFYQTLMDRNVNYLSEVASKGLKTKDDYDKIVPTILVNLNTFSVNNNGKIFDTYFWRNEDNEILTEKQKIVNIDIAKCYNVWYNDTYKSLSLKFYEKELLLLGAAIYTNKIDEFNRCIEELSVEGDIKNEILEVSTVMNGDNELTLRYTDFLEETKRINRSILKDEIKTARKDERQKRNEEIVLNMHKKGASNEIIHSYTELSMSKIQEIIFNYEASKTK